MVENKNFAFLEDMMDYAYPEFQHLIDRDTFNNLGKTIEEAGKEMRKQISSYGFAEKSVDMNAYKNPYRITYTVVIDYQPTLFDVSVKIKEDSSFIYEFTTYDTVDKKETIWKEKDLFKFHTLVKQKIAEIFKESLLYQKHKYPESEYTGPIKLDFTEYPSHEELFSGIEIGKGYAYVSSTYLNGFINYVKFLKTYMCLAYTEAENVLEILDKVQIFLKNEWYPHTDLGKLPSDFIFIIGELEDSYVVFEYDSDVSDCCMCRIDKQYSFEEVNDYVVHQMKYRKECNNNDYEEYIELPRPGGWINY